MTLEALTTSVIAANAVKAIAATKGDNLALTSSSYTRTIVTRECFVTLKNNARLVYSTQTSGKCPVCGWPQRDCQCSDRRRADEPVSGRIVAKLRMEKTGRGGKTVTVVYGLPENDAFLKELSQELKRACSTGGTVVDGGIELQGDVRERVRAILIKRAYVVKG